VTVLIGGLEPWLLGLIVGLVSLFALCLIGWGYYYFVIVRRRRLLKLKRPKLGKFEEQMQTLFMLMDTDSSGYIENAEMERSLSWLRNHVTDGEKWCTVMYEALPREDEMTEEDKVKMAKEAAAAPAPAAKMAQEATTAPTPAAATLEALEEMVDEMDAARKKPAAEALTTDEIDFVEGGKMNLAEFTAWMKLVTASFEKETYDMVIRQLIAYLTKEQQATRLFKAWDDDNSGELEMVELRKILDIFEEQIKIDDEEFHVMEEMKAQKDVESGQAVKQETNYAGWTNNVIASLDDMAAKKGLNLPAFKVWLIDVSGHLEPATFDKAYAKLMEVVKKDVSNKLIFKMWDRDGSGHLDFGELGEVLKWLAEQLPGTLVFRDLFAALPEPVEGKISEKQFSAWLTNITGGLSMQQYETFQEKLKDHLRAIGEDPDGTVSAAVDPKAASTAADSKRRVDSTKVYSSDSQVEA